MVLLAVCFSSKIVQHEKSGNGSGICGLCYSTGKATLIVPETEWHFIIFCLGLSKLGVSCDEVNYVVCTHGHSDHVGNLNLFQRATHIVGSSVSNGDVYQLDAFEKVRNIECFCDTESY